MSKFYRGPSIDASYQVSYHLAKLFQKSTNKKQELPTTAMFVNGSQRNEQFPQRTFYRSPRFGPFGQAVSEQKIFRNRPIRNKNCMWWSCLLMDRDEMSNRNKRTFHRSFLPSFSSFGQMVSEEKNLKNQPIRNKNRLWWPCLLTDRDGTSNRYRGPSIDASYQVSYHCGFRGKAVLEIDQ